MARALLMIYLINHAGLSDARMNEVKKSVEYFFTDAEILIIWSDQVVPSGASYYPLGTINVLLTDAISSKATCKNEDAVGCAPVGKQTRRGSLAFVFTKLIDRVEFEAGTFSGGILLPRIIVHEIGHLLGLSDTEGHERMMKHAADPKKMLEVIWTASEKRELHNALRPAE